MTPLKAVIFDYGNVLCEAQQPEDLEGMAHALGVDRAGLEEFYWRRRLAYDKTELTTREYWDDFCRMAGVARLSNEALDRVTKYDCLSWSHGNAKMIAWAGQLRSSGLKTAVLSNMPLCLREYLDAAFAWLHNFDYRVFSCDARMAKPQPAIYELCIQGLQVAPHEALFLDDRPDNITAARRLGMHALLFTTAEDAQAQLEGRYTIPELAV